MKAVQRKVDRIHGKRDDEGQTFEGLIEIHVSLDAPAPPKLVLILIPVVPCPASAWQRLVPACANSCKNCLASQSRIRGWGGDQKTD